MTNRAALKRSLVAAAGLVVVAVVGLALLLFVGPSNPEASKERPRENEASNEAGTKDLKVAQAEANEPVRKDKEDPISPEARWYARDFGVSVEEADRRMDMQDDTLPSDLERELKKTEGDVFAGLWLRHEPDYGLTVATAGDPEAMMQKIEPFVAGTQWEGTVNVEQVEASEAQLNEARAEADRIIDRLGISRVSSDLNVFKNRAEFYVPDKAKFERRLDASGLELPEHVAVIEALSRPD